MIDMIN